MNETLTAERLAEIGKYARGVWSAEPYVDEAVIKPWELFCLLDAAEENGRLKEQLASEEEYSQRWINTAKVLGGQFTPLQDWFHAHNEVMRSVVTEGHNDLSTMAVLALDQTLAQMAEWREVAERANRRIEDGNDYGLSDSMEEISALSEKYPKGGEG